MEQPDILFEQRGRTAIATLNRPQALNALTLSMVRDLRRALAGWAEDAGVDRVLVRAAGERAFCAGGDIRRIYEWAQAGDPVLFDFFREEYRLNTAIKRYRKPYLALIDGVFMGGGAGISVHGSRRIGGSRALFAMPETAIGSFPDVGGTYFLPRLPGRLGTWLALTGARLDQAEALWAGILTHAVASERMAELAEALAATDDVDAALSAFSVDPGPPGVAALMPVIDRCFSADRVEAILERLDAEGGEHAGWARRTAAEIRRKAPRSLKIALRQMRLGAGLGFEDCMRTEFRIMSRLCRTADYREGVRAVIIDKDNRPLWDPDKLADVGDAEIDGFFAPLAEAELQIP